MKKYKVVREDFCGNKIEAKECGEYNSKSEAMESINYDYGLQAWTFATNDPYPEEESVVEESSFKLPFNAEDYDKHIVSPEGLCYAWKITEVEVDE